MSRYWAEFSSTDDPDWDAILGFLEDHQRTVQEAQTICRHFGVRAWLVANEVRVFEVDRLGNACPCERRHG